jgi:hypothetical protein
VIVNFNTSFPNTNYVVELTQFWGPQPAGYYSLDNSQGTASFTIHIVNGSGVEIAQSASSAAGIHWVAIPYNNP